MESSVTRAGLYSVFFSAQQVTMMMAISSIPAVSRSARLVGAPWLAARFQRRAASVLMGASGTATHDGHPQQQQHRRQRHGKYQCRRVQSSATPPPNGRLFPTSRSGLGLMKTFVYEQPSTVLTNLTSLPEIAQLQNPQLISAASDATPLSFTSTTDGLLRAMDIFAAYQKGGAEHKAMLAILAEWYQRNGQHASALETLRELQANSQATSPALLLNDITMALAKASWYNGDLELAEQLCSDFIQSEYDDVTDSFSSQTATNLQLASAISGKALCRFAAMSSMQDAYSVRDFFAVTARFLQRHASSSSILAEAIAQNNAGVAEAGYAIFVQQHNDVDVPIDAALRLWFRSAQKMKSQLDVPHPPRMTQFVLATLQTNIAWGVLNYEDRKDRLAKASEYAKQALSNYDAFVAVATEADGSAADPHNYASLGLIRTLCIVAACCHQGGQAVTAEGLLQSALDKIKKQQERKQQQHSLQLLEWKDAYLGLSRLYKDWEKRENESARYEQMAKDLDDSEHMHPAWKGRDGIHSTLWFWTPEDAE